MDRQEALWCDRRITTANKEEAIKSWNHSSGSAGPLGQAAIVVDMLGAAEECQKHLVLLLNTGPTRLLSVSHCCRASKARAGCLARTFPPLRVISDLQWAAWVSTFRKLMHTALPKPVQEEPEWSDAQRKHGQHASEHLPKRELVKQTF